MAALLNVPAELKKLPVLARVKVMISLKVFDTSGMVYSQMAYCAAT